MSITWIYAGIYILTLIVPLAIAGIRSLRGPGRRFARVDRASSLLSLLGGLVLFGVVYVLTEAKVFIPPSIVHLGSVDVTMWIIATVLLVVSVAGVVLSWSSLPWLRAEKRSWRITWLALGSLPVAAGLILIIILIPS